MMIILVTGGARSGKSTFAEGYFKNRKDVVYIATSIVADNEMEERVKLHKSNRPQYWRTYEGYHDLIYGLGKEKNYILECITTLVSNIMFDLTRDLKQIDYYKQCEIENRAFKELHSLVEAINDNGYDLILVTNEIGYSLVPNSQVGRIFRDIQGRINQKMAALSDEVYLVCCGIPVRIK